MRPRVFVLCVLALVVLAADRPGSQEWQLRQPAEWVPFSASLRHTAHFNGTIEVVLGRFHRGSDGSTRAETGQGDKMRIAVRNRTRVAGYAWSRQTGWIDMPMTLGPHGARPAPWSTANLIPIGDLYEGLRIVRLNVPNGRSFRLMAPDLNMFAVRSFFCSERGQCELIEFHDIRIGEQPPELFEPRDASLRRSG
jgi:hypothetical protein